MNKGIGAAIGITFIIVAFLFMPNVMTTTEDLKTRDISEDHLVTTGVAETTADVVIYEELYDASLSYVEDIYSSDSGDTPVATAYNEVTKILTVGGLVVDTTRTLQIDYHADALEDVMGMRQFSNLAPFLIMGALIACGGGVLWHVFRNR